MALIGVRRALLAKKKVATGFTPTSAQSAAFLARATGITSNTDKTNYDAFITGLVSDGVWASLDALWQLIAPDSVSQLLNLVSSSFTLTPHNYSFVAKTPVTGDGTSLYFSTGYTPSSSGTNFIQDSAAFGAKHTNTRSAGQVWSSMGLLDGNKSDRMLVNFNGTLFIGAINCNQFNPSISGTLPGLWSEDRSGATTADIFKDGTSQNTDTTASNVPSTLEIFLMAENIATVASNFSGDTISMFFLSGSLGATLQGNLNTRVTTFNAAYGF